MRRVAALLLLSVLLASCSGTGDRADTTTTPGAVTTQAAATGQIEGSFDVGGHKLYLRCQGNPSPGSPTVVYLHGLGGDGSDVSSISAPLASRLRGCTYDRVNVGRSDSDAGCHTGADSVRDLHALLDAAGVGERAQAIAEQEANRERVEFYRTVDEAKALVARVPDLPVTYMAARPVELPPTWPVKRMQALIHAKQVQFTRRCPTAGWSRCDPPMTSTWSSRRS